MAEDFFLKKMKGVKPLKKNIKHTEDTSIEKNLKLDKNILTKHTHKKTTTENKKNYSEFELSFGDVNKELKRGKVKIDRRLDLHGYSLTEAYQKFKNEVKKTIIKIKDACL